MDILSRPVLTADHRIHYDAGPWQFGDLWIPQTRGRSLLPLVVFYHGGWWKSEYDLGYAGYLCAALKKEGIASWSVEYRRVGETGGAWPATFQDAAAGFDFVATLARSYPLDLSRVITMGHSAGGHLAFWVAGRHHIDAHSEIYQPRPQVPLHGAVSLAGAVDLRLTIDLSGYFTFAHDKDEVYDLMGGVRRICRIGIRRAIPETSCPSRCLSSLSRGRRTIRFPLSCHRAGPRCRADSGIRRP